MSEEKKKKILPGDPDKVMTRRTAIKVGLLGLAGISFGLKSIFAWGEDDRELKEEEKTGKFKIVAINGSPRKDMNTATLLKQALEGAKERGAHTDLINLYEINYHGCISCLACKLKNPPSPGLCAYRDALTPVLKQCMEADALIFGSPIYYDNVNGMTREFLERLMFPIDPYKFNKETGQRERYLTKIVPVGMIYTMNCPEEMRERFYGHMFRSIEGYISHIFGSCYPLYAANTYQFKDYSLYEDEMAGMEPQKRLWRDKQWPIDLENAYQLGMKLIDDLKVQTNG